MPRQVGGSGGAVVVVPEEVALLVEQSALEQVGKGALGLHAAAQARAPTGSQARRAAREEGMG